ncbi:glycosyltransferase [Brevibacterium daeguense]|uniref:glycosyltransferase n=1 Tax=Brevibacterium daeguense TaxID=909936 RepID=UPI0031D417D4
MLASILAFRVIGRFATSTDQFSTRAGNLERRTGQVAEAAVSLRDRIESAERDLAQMKTELSERSEKDDAEGQAFEALAQEVARVHRDLKVLRRRVPANFLAPVKSDLAELKNGTADNTRVAFESALQLGRRPENIISKHQATKLFRDYLNRDELLQLRPLIEGFDLLRKQQLTTLRRLYRFYRGAGYWDLASTILTEVHRKSGRDSDAHAVKKIQHEIELFSYPTLVHADLAPGNAYDPTGPILHMVGRVLPQTQTGYTLRTQYTAVAQAKKGLPVAVVGQSGITDFRGEEAAHYTHMGIDYYLLPGDPRNEMLIDDWLRENIVHLGRLVMKLRPSILHAQSDFFNALITDAVGKKYGIPTAYESRGFWEESWLSRVIDSNDWADEAARLFAMYGKPAAYELRKHAEEVSRLLPNHVFTLAEVMKSHILQAADGSLSETDVTIVPNAVDSGNFPVQGRDQALAAEIGIPEGAVTIGYISSLVEYEGIDTLIDAYHLARASVSQTTCLLLVGDGDYRSTLQEHVERRGVENVVFTGRVPHEDVLRYYGLIDIFVVPRKPSAVAHLVTPLKPFEAFSTGRAVVLSDVGALQEIADQSGAVETFRAGSADSLAAKLIALINDPERRHDLSRRAARWVRNYRSWDRNVNEYYKAYRKLGYSGPDNTLIESEIALTERGINPGELLEELTAAKLPPSKGWFTIQDIRQSARSVLEDGWRFASFEPVPVTSIREWSRYGEEHRSWGFHLHAWEFMDPLIREFDEEGDPRWIEAAVHIAVRWIESHLGVDEDQDPMAWYDMSLSLRTPRLLALALRAARIDGMREQTVVLAEAIAWHLDELHKDRAFNPNNNHGFYTAVSQVHAAKYCPMFPAAQPTAEEGKERLARMAQSQFAVDGVHLEHSPDYHRMLLNSFELAVTDGLIEDEEVKGRIERAAHVLGWMIQPDGTLVQFGDSPETRMVGREAKSIDPETQYILSDGEQGRRPSLELAVYSDGGYAFVRSPQPNGPGALRQSGYLAFSAAFHSRAHKHADDLNLVWFDRGQQILTDSGRFGYGDLLPADSPMRRDGFYYAAPERQYVEGTMAHNTLMMDGRNQERRTRTPYGSGIGECSENDGVFDLSGRVHHADYIHRRRLIYRPGSELLIKDSVFSQSPETREGTLWFNISGIFEVESAEESVVFVASTEAGSLRLVVSGPGTMIEPVRGQMNPMRGWRSRQDRSLEPTWSLGFRFPIDTRASVETRLALE